MSDASPDDLALSTQVVTGGRRHEWTHDGRGRGIVNTPVWRASTILYDDVADLRAAARQPEEHRLFYGRRGTPTQWSLADALTAAGAWRGSDAFSIPPAWLRSPPRC